MEKQTTVIEIKGVKLEVDLRTAKRVEHLQVGSRVKCLVKGYGNDYKVHPGVIVGFEPFNNLPSIVVAYLDIDYSSTKITFKSYNGKTDDFEIVADLDNNAIEVNKSDVLLRFNREMELKRRELEDLERKQAFFLRNFGVYFAEYAKDEAF